MARTGLVYAEKMLLHDTGEDHPESSERLSAIIDALQDAHIELPRIAITPATEDDLLRFHCPEHLERIRVTCAANGHYPDPDTPMSPDSWDAALLAVGGAISGCKAVLDGVCDNVFCALRPPGHHAEFDRAMGFCLFNNVAIAARWLRDMACVERVAIVDWDVHHGNGTQQAFLNDSSVYFVSIHQHPHYPGTGWPSERGAGNTNLNIQMRAGAGPSEWQDALDTIVLPELRAFDPQVLLISAGFDAHQLDPLGDQRLDADTYACMTRQLRTLANGRIVSVLEGGYHPEALAQCVLAHIRALMED